jgi:CRISPR/Cas system endoribonuclease Cas6 (RAMP superfamily)
MKRNKVYEKDIANVLRTANNVNNLNQTVSNLKMEIKSLEQKRMYLFYHLNSSYSLQPLSLNKLNYNYYRY